MSLQVISADASPRPIELVCPAGSLPALKSAIDLGADCVYLGFRDATNARNFAGLNFDDAAIAKASIMPTAMAASAAGPEHLSAAGNQCAVAHAIDRAASAGVDAVILADPA
jgi:putative protease